jgi:hypothetical protein
LIQIGNVLVPNVRIVHSLEDRTVVNEKIKWNKMKQTCMSNTILSREAHGIQNVLVPPQAAIGILHLLGIGHYDALPIHRHMMLGGASRWHRWVSF